MRVHLSFVADLGVGGGGWGYTRGLYSRLYSTGFYGYGITLRTLVTQRNYLSFIAIFRVGRPWIKNCRIRFFFNWTLYLMRQRAPLNKIATQTVS